MQIWVLDFLSFCRNRTDDFGINSLALWPTELVLHRLGYYNIDKLNFQTKYTYMFGCLVVIVCGLFVEIYFLFTLSDTIVLWRKYVSERFFFEIWNNNEKPKTKSAKRELEKTGGTTKRNRLGQVGVCKTNGTGTGGSPHWVEPDGTGRMGSSN